MDYVKWNKHFVKTVNFFGALVVNPWSTPDFHHFHTMTPHTHTKLRTNPSTNVYGGHPAQFTSPIPLLVENPAVGPWGFGSINCGVVLPSQVKRNGL